MKLLKVLLPLLAVCGVAYAGTYTSNLNLYKPALSETGWGTAVNNNMTIIDSMTAATIDQTSIDGWDVGGSDTQVQFNDGGSFGGDPLFVYTKTTDILSIGGKLGVGTSAPTNALDVIGTITATTGTFTLVTVPTIGSNSGSIYFSAPIASGTGTIGLLVLPNSLSASILTTDASGVVRAGTTGSGTVSTGTTGSVAFYNTTGTTVSGTSVITVNQGSVLFSTPIASGTGTIGLLVLPNSLSASALTTDASGIVRAGTGGAGTPSGNDTEIQYNDGGSFGGDTGMTFTESTNVLTLTGAIVSPTGTFSTISATAGSIYFSAPIASGTGTLGDLILSNSKSAAVLTTDSSGVVRAGTASAPLNLILKVVGETDSFSTGNGALKITLPLDAAGKNLVDAQAHVYTVGTIVQGSTTIQVSNQTDGVDMLSTAITIDPAENDSKDGATQRVIDATYDDVAEADVLSIDIDGAPGSATGLEVRLKFN